MGLPLLEAVESEHLLARLLSAHGKYLPTQPEDLNPFLRLSLADGRGPFPVRDFTTFIADSVRVSEERLSSAEASRSLASAVLLTAYATAPWERENNHSGVAEGWLSLCVVLMYAASRHQLPDAGWRDSFDLALTAARGRLLTLLEGRAGQPRTSS